MSKLREQVAALEAEVERLRDMRDFYKSARDELITERNELAERLWRLQKAASRTAKQVSA